MYCSGNAWDLGSPPENLEASTRGGRTRVLFCFLARGALEDGPVDGVILSSKALARTHEEAFLCPHFC